MPVHPFRDPMNLRKSARALSGNFGALLPVAENPQGLVATSCRFSAVFEGLNNYQHYGSTFLLFRPILACIYHSLGGLAGHPDCLIEVRQVPLARHHASGDQHHRGVLRDSWRAGEVRHLLRGTNEYAKHEDFAEDNFCRPGIQRLRTRIWHPCVYVIF